MTPTFGWFGNWTLNLMTRHWLDANLRVLALASIALLACLLLRRRSAATSHFAMSCLVIGALLLPGISPTWTLVNPIAVTLTPSTGANDLTARAASIASLRETAARLPLTIAREESRQAGISAPQSEAAVPMVFLTGTPSPRIDWSPVLRAAFLTWLAGAVALIALHLTRLALVWRFVSSCPRIQTELASHLLKEALIRFGVRRRVYLRASCKKESPTTWGFLRPTVMLPEDHRHWSADCLRTAIWHEMAHVRRVDWLTQQLADAACALYWFNPLVWLCARRLRADAEYAADDLLIVSGIEKESYASQLLAIARRMGASGASVFGPAMSRGSQLEGRIVAVLESRKRGRLRGKSKLLLSALACLSIFGLGLFGPRIPALSPTGEVSAFEGNFSATGEAMVFDGPPEEERFAWQPQELADIFGTHRGRHWWEVTAVAYSPDGRLIATGGGAKNLRLWHAGTMREYASVMGLPGRVTSVAFTPDGKRLAAAVMDTQVGFGSTTGEIRIWELSDSGLEELDRLTGFAPRALAVSSDGKSLAAACLNSEIRLFDITGDRPSEQHVLPAGDTPWDIEFGPRGGVLAAACSESMVLWNLEEAKPYERARITTGALSIAFTPDGKTLASGGGYTDRSIHFWDLENTAPRRRALLRDVAGTGIRALTFSPDGSLLASSTGSENRIRLWSTEEGEPEQIAVLEGHSAKTFDLAFSPDGKHLASASSDRTLRIWGIGPTPRESNVSRSAHVGAAVNLAFLPDQRSIAVIRQHGNTNLRPPVVIDMLDREVRTTLELPASERYYSFGMQLAPNGSTLATTHRTPILKPVGTGQSLASREMSVMLWELPTGKRLHTLTVDCDSFTAKAFSLAFSRTSRLLATASSDRIHVWDVVGGKLRAQQVSHDHEFLGLVFLADAELVSLSADVSETGSSTPIVAKLWHLRKNRLVEAETWETPTPAEFGVLSPDGKLAAIKRRMGGVEIWEFREDRYNVLKHVDPQPNYQIQAFSPDGTMLSTTTRGEGPCEVSVWDTSTGNLLKDWRFPGGTRKHTFSTDQQHLATVNWDGTVYILPIPRD